LAALADAQEMLGGYRRCTICREMTKLHEEIWRGTLSEALSEWHAREPRGEFTLVITGAAPPATRDEAQVRSALADLLVAGISHSEAARQVARQSGWPKSTVYALCPAARR